MRNGECPPISLPPFVPDAATSAERGNGESETLRLQARERVALIQAPTTWTAWEERGRRVFKFKCAENTTQHVPECAPFPALPPPFGQNPRTEDQAEHNPQINKNKPLEADRNHGEGVRVYASSPQRTRAVPHVISSGAN